MEKIEVVVISTLLSLVAQAAVQVQVLYFSKDT